MRRERMSPARIERAVGELTDLELHVCPRDPTRSAHPCIIRRAVSASDFPVYSGYSGGGAEFSGHMSSMAAAACGMRPVCVPLDVV